jgi:hypothetical protein
MKTSADNYSHKITVLSSFNLNVKWSEFRELAYDAFCRHGNDRFEWLPTKEQVELIIAFKNDMRNAKYECSGEYVSELLKDKYSELTEEFEANMENNRREQYDENY